MTVIEPPLNIPVQQSPPRLLNTLLILYGYVPALNLLIQLFNWHQYELLFRHSNLGYETPLLKAGQVDIQAHS